LKFRTCAAWQKIVKNTFPKSIYISRDWEKILRFGKTRIIIKQTYPNNVFELQQWEKKKWQRRRPLVFRCSNYFMSAHELHSM